MFKVMMIVDGNSYCYGKWNDEDKAVAVAIEVSAQRDVETYIEES